MSNDPSDLAPRATHLANENEMINTAMPQFDTWTHKNLANFAKDTYAKLQQQDDRIQQLQCELKDAIQAYRAVLRTSEGRLPGAPSPSQTSASSAAQSGTPGAAQGTVEVIRRAWLEQLPPGFEARSLHRP